MKVIDMKKERTVFEDICWQLDKEENEYLPQVEISELVSSTYYAVNRGTINCCEFRHQSSKRSTSDSR